MDYEKELGKDMPVNKWFYLPRIGEEVIIDVVKISKKTDGKPEYNFMRNKKIKLPDGTEAEQKENLGYNMEVECFGGRILSIGSLSAFLSTFVKHDIQEGDVVKIMHKDKGVWEVEKILKEVQI